MRKLFVGILLSIVSTGSVSGNQVAEWSDEELSRAALLEHHERDFRLQVYQTFREDRDQFERRRAAWSRIRAGWRDNGGDPGDHAQLIAWLQEATRASRPDTFGPLPADPQFGAWSENPGPADVAWDPPGNETVAELESPATVEAYELSPVDLSRINLTELAAGIAGYNFGLRAMESDLYETAHLGIDQLNSAVDRLETLTVRRGDLSLYVDLMPPETKAQVGTFAAPGEVFKLLGNHISARHSKLELSSATNSTGGHQSELADLDGLSKRLDELYTKSQNDQEPTP